MELQEIRKIKAAAKLVQMLEKHTKVRESFAYRYCGSGLSLEDFSAFTYILEDEKKLTRSEGERDTVWLNKV